MLGPIDVLAARAVGALLPELVGVLRLVANAGGARRDAGLCDLVWCHDLHRDVPADGDLSDAALCEGLRVKVVWLVRARSQ